jgi:osomolarity two-component system sensor histidine kinase SLN1
MAKESGINLSINFEGLHHCNTTEPSGVEGSKLSDHFRKDSVKNIVLWGDKSRILQVLINLSSNALKFTSKGGDVSIVIRCLGYTGLSRKGSIESKPTFGPNSTQRMYSAGPEILEPPAELYSTLGQSHSVTEGSSPPPGARNLTFEFEVQDTGPGIPKSVQEKIFEPFFQGDMQLSKKYSGTGLGLSICSQLADLLHGTIALTSVEGRGSTFTMRIPLKHITCRADSTISSTFKQGINEKDPVSKYPDHISSTERFPFPVYQDDRQPTLAGQDGPLSSSNPVSSDKSLVVATERQIGRKLKILVAEDNKTNQMVILRMLRMENILNVEIAEGRWLCRLRKVITNYGLDGKKAINMVQASISSHSEYDLIFMDVQASRTSRTL